MQILTRIPSWVFLLLIVLLALGVSQSKERVISSTRVSVLPIVMLILSFLGVLSQRGETLFAVLAWGVGVTNVLWIYRRWIGKSKALYLPDRNQFRVPGSWTPLALMMGIFLAKTMVGITTAMNPGLATSAVFALATGLVYGLLSGVFLARGLSILRIRHAPAHCELQVA